MLYLPRTRVDTVIMHLRTVEMVVISYYLVPVQPLKKSSYYRVKVKVLPQ